MQYNYGIGCRKTDCKTPRLVLFHKSHGAFPMNKKWSDINALSRQELREWLSKAKTEEIEECLKNLSPTHSAYTVVKTELETRTAKVARTPHWTLTPLFVVAVVTMVFAAIAAWPVIQEWLRPVSSSRTTANSPLQQSRSESSSQSTPPVLPPAPSNSVR